MFSREAFLHLMRFVLVSVVAATGAAYGEFLRTAPGVYQSTGKRAKVILSQEQPGIFVLYGDEVELQLFNPAVLKSSPNVDHVFIRYDPSSNRYNGIVFGGREYRIAGSFTLLIGKARVTIDNSNPYCSIVLDSNPKEAEVLGLMGLSVIVNYTGQEAVALLEANQFSEYRGVLKPYVVSQGRLLLNGQPLSINAIGVTVETKNPCLQLGAIWLDKEELEKVREGKDKEVNKKVLTEILAGAKGRDPLKGLLKLRTTSDSIIALDPMSGETRVAKKAPFLASSQVICTVEKTKLGL